MRPTNYFKARTSAGTYTYPFETWDRGSIRAAFNLATTLSDAYRGTLSVFYPVPISGPWDSVPAIAGEDAPLPIWIGKRRVQAPSLFGEAGCY